MSAPDDITAILTALREPAALIDPDGSVREVNLAWDTLSRRTDAPALVTAGRGTSLPSRARTAQLNGVFDGARIARGIEDVLQGARDELDLELSWSMGGLEHWYLLTVTPLRGPLQGALVLHREITAQKLAQDSLSNAWDFYLRIFDDFPSLIWRSGEDGRPSYFNRTWLEFTGKSVPQQRGDGWLEVVHPSDRKGVEAGFSAALAAREPLQLELRLRRADGEHRWVVAAGRPYSRPDGTFGGYVVVFTDITELRRAEVLALENMDTYAAGAPGAHPPLHEHAPELFQRFTARYGDLLDLALERQAYKDVTAAPSAGLKELAERLAALNAGPRDVVELHTRVLRERVTAAGAVRRQAYLSEGRLMVLELMGNLAAQYQLRSAAASLVSDARVP